MFNIYHRDDFSEVGYRISRENDKIDSKYGFDRVKDTLERTGYLINMHSVSTHFFICKRNNKMFIYSFIRLKFLMMIDV